MASCGDVPTYESLAATALLREHLPEIKVRVVNVVDLFKLIPQRDHPHGLSDEEFRVIFTDDKPVIFNFHSYPWLIHRLTYRRKGQHNLHVCGYREKGNVDTPLELAIRNGTDRYSLSHRCSRSHVSIWKQGLDNQRNVIEQADQSQNLCVSRGCGSKRECGVEMDILEWSLSMCL